MTSRERKKENSMDFTELRNQILTELTLAIERNEQLLSNLKKGDGSFSSTFREEAMKRGSVKEAIGIYQERIQWQKRMLDKYSETQSKSRKGVK